MFRRDQPELCNQIKRLDSRDFKKESTFSSSNKLRKSSGLPPTEIFINVQAVQSMDETFSVPLNYSQPQQHQRQPQQQECQNNALYSLLFPQSSTAPSTSQKGIENILQTQATSVVTNSDCDNNSMGTIDILPTNYLSWEMTESSFADDLFQPV